MGLTKTMAPMAYYTALALMALTTPTSAAISHLRPPAVHAVQRAALTRLIADEAKFWKLELDLGNAGTANLRLKQTMPNSEPIIVRYTIPFGLNVESQRGKAVCTKDGEGGEKVGGVLRYTTAWSMGLPRGDGVVSTVASFGGAIGWQISLFDVSKASSWDAVVEALVSNTPERTDSVTLVFERPLTV